MILISEEKKSQSTMLTSSVDTSLGAIQNTHMAMYESDLFLKAKAALEASGGVRQALEVFPEGSEIRIILDQRLPGILKMKDGNPVLLAEDSGQPDFELSLNTEAIRRLKSLEFSNFLSIAMEISTQVIQGHIKIKILKSPMELHRKGYLISLKKFGPEIEGIIYQLALKALGRAQSIAEIAKSFLKRP